MRKHETKLLDRLRELERSKRRRYSRAALWSGGYGYGRGLAHPSVEFAPCELCGSQPGRLCIGKGGPILGIHFVRSKLLRKMKRDAYAKLAAKIR